MARNSGRFDVEGNVMKAVVLGRKAHEVVDRRAFAVEGLPIVYLNWHEVQIAALEVVWRNVSGWCVILANLFANVLNLAASRRLLLDTLLALFRQKRPSGFWPTIGEWLAMIESVSGSPTSRKGQYREASSFALKSLYIELREAIDYSQSDFWDRFESLRGILVISTAGLSSEAESMLAGLLVNSAFCRREGIDPEKLEPLVFCIDDCMGLVKGTGAMDAEGSNRNPMATFTHMSRSRKIGFVLSLQNYGVVSPSIANNCSTVLAFGSYGADANLLGRHLNLTKEQTATLPAIQPGECVAMARTVYPVAVRGRVPLIQ